MAVISQATAIHTSRALSLPNVPDVRHAHQTPITSPPPLQARKVSEAGRPLGNPDGEPSDQRQESRSRVKPIRENWN